MDEPSAPTPRVPISWAFVALVPIVTVIVLRLMGRPWFCACGVPSLWISDTLSAHNSQHLFDPYSFTHILHGFAFCAIFSWLLPGDTPPPLWRKQFGLALVFESLWEIAENSPLVILRYRSATAAFGYLGDSMLNSCGDLLCCGTGFLLARALGFRRAVAVFVITELILLWWIRDNLTLNILMLLYPVEGIKAWQLAH